MIYIRICYIRNKFNLQQSWFPFKFILFNPTHFIIAITTIIFLNLNKRTNIVALG